MMRLAVRDSPSPSMSPREPGRSSRQLISQEDTSLYWQEGLLFRLDTLDYRTHVGRGYISFLIRGLLSIQHYVVQSIEILQNRGGSNLSCENSYGTEITLFAGATGTPVQRTAITGDAPAIVKLWLILGLLLEPATLPGGYFC